MKLPWGGRPQEAAEAFQKPLSELGDGDWPRPHLLFLTGQINLGELLDIASKTESVLESMHQKCEAFYYAAMLQFAARNAWMGQYYLRSAIEMKRPESWQYRMALGELMRIEWGAKKTSF